MSFPKNKLRKITIGDVVYEWVFSSGTLYYKNQKQTMLMISVPEMDIVSPKFVAKAITNNFGSKIDPKIVAINKEAFNARKLKDRSQFKLFVWEDVLKYWTSGIIFAYARTLTEARKKILEESNNCTSVKAEVNKPPTHFSAVKLRDLLFMVGDEIFLERSSN